MKFILLVLVSSFNMNGGDTVSVTTAEFDDINACVRAQEQYAIFASEGRSTPFKVKSVCTPKALRLS